jgi:hypothetical protein
MKTIDFTRVNNDVYGNPRYVSLLKEDEKTLSNHGLAVKRANKLGGKKYRGRDFGGGIVFQSYNIDDLRKYITDMLENV